MKIPDALADHLKVVTAEQMRELDRRATEQYGIPSLLLMENAGRVVYEECLRILGNIQGKRIFVICGPGNNGGDGFVVARFLHNAGANVFIAYYGDRSKAKGDALTNVEIAEKMGLKIEYNLESTGDLWGKIQPDLIVDALLGTGIKGELRKPFSEVLFYMALAKAQAKIIAVDIPSGLDANTGQKLGLVVPVDSTVTFALPKAGLLMRDGLELVGDLVIADIGIPRNALEDDKYQTYMITRLRVINLDPPCIQGIKNKRTKDSNKGTFGHLAIIAGSVGMTGAATLAAQGALRIGTGLVTLLVPESLNDIMEVKVTEAMTIPVPEGNARAFGMASLDKVLEYANKWDAAVIGPGFGRDEDTIEFTLELIRRLEKPAIIDADALYAVSKDLSVLKECKAPLVITPHPGEMATLLGTTTAEVQSNRLEVARSFAKEHGVCVVLKGAGTIIAEPEGQAFINTTGTPGMATGGTGDVLSGMLGGLLAQKINPSSAAQIAVYTHGLAGEIAANRLGEAAMIASDVADSISNAIQEVLREPYEKE